MAMESVWDYPRPPRLEPTAKRLTVELGGVVVADTTRAHRVLETSHPPIYYIPPDYPELMDSCTVDGEVVSPQPGGFYGGWITSDLVGPFKGEPGTAGW